LPAFLKGTATTTCRKQASVGGCGGRFTGFSGKKLVSKTWCFGVYGKMMVSDLEYQVRHVEGRSLLGATNIIQLWPLIVMNGMKKLLELVGYMSLKWGY